MPLCSAYNCNYVHRSKRHGKTIHRFPFSRPLVLKQWLINVRRADFNPTPSSVLCSDHFTEDCFYSFDRYVTLRKDAVPTIFDFSTSSTEETSSEEDQPILLSMPEHDYAKIRKAKSLAQKLEERKQKREAKQKAEKEEQQSQGLQTVIKVELENQDNEKLIPFSMSDHDYTKNWKDFYLTQKLEEVKHQQEINGQAEAEKQQSQELQIVIKEENENQESQMGLAAVNAEQGQQKEVEINLEAENENHKRQEELRILNERKLQAVQRLQEWKRRKRLDKIEDLKKSVNEEALLRVRFLKRKNILTERTEQLMKEYIASPSFQNVVQQKIVIAAFKGIL